VFETEGQRAQTYPKTEGEMKKRDKKNEASIQSLGENDNSWQAIKEGGEKGHKGQVNTPRQGKQVTNWKTADLEKPHQGVPIKEKGDELEGVGGVARGRG